MSEKETKIKDDMIEIPTNEHDAIEQYSQINSVDILKITCALWDDPVRPNQYILHLSDRDIIVEIVNDQAKKIDDSTEWCSAAGESHDCDICEKTITYFGELSDTCTEYNRHMCKECNSGRSTGAYHEFRCWCKSCYEISSVFITEREVMIKHHERAIKALDETCHEACLAALSSGESDNS